MKATKIISILMLGLLLLYFILATPKKRNYTIIIYNGKSNIHYTSEMQVDSFKRMSSTFMIVFVDSFELPIKGDVITFKKN